MYFRFHAFMILKRNAFFFFLWLILAMPFCFYAQTTDSLSAALKKEKEDSLILAAQLEDLEFKKESNDKKALSFAYHNVGQAYYDKQEYPTAIEYYMLSLITCRETGDDIGIATCYQNLADAHKNATHYAEAIRYYTDAIEVYTELGARNDIADCYLNISKIYEIKKNIHEAINYTRKAQDIYSDKRNEPKISECAARIKELKAKR